MEIHQNKKVIYNFIREVPDLSPNQFLLSQSTLEICAFSTIAKSLLNSSASLSLRFIWKEKSQEN